MMSQKSIFDDISMKPLQVERFHCDGLDTKKSKASYIFKKGLEEIIALKIYNLQLHLPICSTKQNIVFLNLGY